MRREFELHGHTEMPRKRRPTGPDYPFHLSGRTNNKVPFPIELDQVWSIFERHLFAMGYFFGARIHAFVLMKNHYHMIARFPENNLSQSMQYLMHKTSLEINWNSNRINQLYGNRHFRSEIRSNHYFSLAYKYIYRNPVKAGIVTRVEDYRYSTLRGLLGSNHCLIPLQEDSTLFNDVEGTLQWLNTAPSKSNERDVGRALKRSVFSLPRVSEKQAVHPLETQLF